MHFRRRKKLVRAGLQLRLVMSFLGIAVLCVLLEFLLIHSELLRAAAAIPNVGGELAKEVPAATVRALVITLVVLVPLLVWVGIWRTFRFAGPVYRFEAFLKNVAAGRQVEPCRLRQGDELGELCELINEVTAPQRQRAADEQSGEPVEGVADAEREEPSEATPDAA